jgi:hypothetical protein
MQSYILSYSLFESVYSDRIQLHRIGLGNPPTPWHLSGRELFYILHNFPDPKDRDRAKVLVASPNPVGKAVSMAKLITDRSKLIRRAKAVVTQANGTDPDLVDQVFAPFALRLRELGVSQEHIFVLLDQALNDEYRLR